MTSWRVVTGSVRPPTNGTGVAVRSTTAPPVIALRVKNCDESTVPIPKEWWVSCVNVTTRPSGVVTLLTFVNCGPVKLYGMSNVHVAGDRLGPLTVRDVTAAPHSGG